MSVNRIDQKFADLRAENRAGFIAYICAGDPTMQATCDLTCALDEAGVDIIELGVPFSDPLADGVVNQLASSRALAAGATVKSLFECVRQIRTRSQIPIVFYTYMNPVYRHGFDAFLKDAEDAGVDGILFLDLPPDEDDANPELQMKGNLKRIRLIAPTTPSARITMLTADAGGFIYYVSREGVTGERSDVADTMAERVEEIRKTTTLPIAVGFGISTVEHVKTVSAAADAVVVGSAIVKRIAEHGASPDLARKIADFVRPLAQATQR